MHYLITVLVLISALMTGACASSPVPCDVTTYEQARMATQTCATNYGEVIPVADGFVAWCVPNEISEMCIYASGRDCPGLTDEQCDTIMTQAFDACLAANLTCN